MAEIRVKETGTIKLFESDNTSNVTIASPASLGADRTVTLPDGDVTLVSGTMSTFDPDGAVTINDSGADVDFRVESNGNANMLTVNGGSNIVGVAADPDLGVGLHVKSADTGASVNAHADELVIEGSRSGLTILSATDEEGSIYFGDSGDDDQGQIVYNQQVSYMKFVTNAAERMRIQSSGNVSIGTSTDAQKLFVYGSHVTDNGLVKVQTSNGTGDVDLLIFYDGNDHECGTISLNATGNSVAYNTSSDYRLKENQVNITDGITRLKQLKPYRFNFIDEPDKTLDGFFAHEAQTVVPEAVHGEKDAMKTVKDVIVNANGTVERYDTSEADWEKGKLDGTFASDSTWEAVKEVIKTQKIDQAKLVPLLVAAVKELTAKVEALENA
jgi:hypothetical protein